MRSSGRIKGFGAGDDVLPEVTAQLGRGPEVNAASQQAGKLVLHRHHLKQADAGLFFEFDEKVDIALRAKVLA
jgi:hypothetical protein